ncbi:conserved Plasmodium protein, unknown function [Plasmodium chabaudi chabaudi]|uniref:Fam-b protein n=2 Tax=Plasmodium chabaudi TaxID=5825 RepID=A0A1D3RS54_PLACU|nr:conserved Plasmodium protein, unknown function [Plasmodium chabaudi chabaudi]SCN59063.1 conserved Plasmodium protein, unknown function [Plasmodium chabaudi adami]
MELAKIFFFFFFFNVSLFVCRTAKYEDSEIIENSTVKNNDITNKNIMNVLKSVSLEENKKTEKNILYDLSYYMNFLKILSGINSQQMEYEGIINIDNTKTKAKNIKDVNIIYSSRKKYKNNIDDVKKNMNTFVFS